MRTLHTVARALPLCSLLFLMAAADECTIHIVDDTPDDDPPSCRPVDCTLYCENGFATDEDGCAICACEEPCAVDSAMVAPECPPGTEPIFDETFCAFECQDAPSCANIDCGEGYTCVEYDGGGAFCEPNHDGCQGDWDCGYGQRCEMRCESDPSCPDCDVCMMVGECVPATGECSSDEDCGDGYICEHYGTADRPADPPSEAPCAIDDPNCGAMPPPPPDGVCVPVSATCFGDEDCQEGWTCQFNDTFPSCPEGAECLVAPSGTCVPPVEPSCETNEDCGDGYTCERITTCGGCGDTCEVLEDGSRVCYPCDPICVEEGVCVPVGPSTCTTDDECAEGQVCLSDCPQCVCDPNSDMPCACAPVMCEGFCVDAEPIIGCDAVLCDQNTECVEDADGRASCQPIGDCGAGSDGCVP